ncbi:MAG: GNAT family N-acetyltransferase [Sphingobacteriaceae bacterium]|nr:GNAT family N-acetyltransferase [Sphingobacteriaceae bacterium]
MPNYLYQDNLQSERLLTRKLISEDFESWANFFRDKEAMEHFPYAGELSEEERAKLWIEKQLKRYENQQFGLQALVDKKTNAFVGQCGLLLQTVDEQSEIEVGYHIFKKYWGQGFAPEAAKLFINFAFEHQLTQSVISIINVNNLKSQRVAEKNGLSREKQTTWSGMDVFIYRIHEIHIL